MMDSPVSSPMSSPILGPRRKKARFSCRRIDKLCCMLATYFPLFFVEGIATWAVYTQAWSLCFQSMGGWTGWFLGVLGVVLYILASWSYLTAVFTSPGSPSDNKHAYSHLPTSESVGGVSVTVKSDGQERFCKKCQARKPDRTHHCSSCRTCILKMDHHCPWLANCLGLYNYKYFLLFLIYTSIFSLLCFTVSSVYVYQELFSTTPPSHVSQSPDKSNKYPTGDFSQDITPVNWVMLAVISGILGLVLTGFTIWHLTLVGSGQTTIESLEKVRYTTPSIRHAGVAPPGANYLESSSLPPSDEARAERAEAYDRYTSYILEESQKRLPHAFNLGLRRNFAQVFGHRRDWYKWGLPLWSSIGDGWTWDTSAEWKLAVEAMRTERERIGQEQVLRERAAGWGYDATEEAAWNSRHAAFPNNGGNPGGLVAHATNPNPSSNKKWRHPLPLPPNGNGNGKINGNQSKAERILGRMPGAYTDMEPRGERVPLRRMMRRKDIDYISSDDDDDNDDNDEDGDVDLDVELEDYRNENLHRHHRQQQDGDDGEVVVAAAGKWVSWGATTTGERGGSRRGRGTVAVW